MHVLSIPTWIIHTSSVIEWLVAIWLIWKYGEVQQNPAWQALAWAMLPALISAMCACTWHYFDNNPDLEWLVTVQATFTLIGNFTLWAAAWWLLHQTRQPELSPLTDESQDVF
jgi:chromate transport protein ChrA